MGKDARRRKKQAAAAAKLPTIVHDVPDHLLKLVIRRLDTHVSLLRAAAVCKRWRRIAAGRGVLDWNWIQGSGNFLSRHPGPHFLGHYHAFDPSHSPTLGGHSFTFVPVESSSVNARHFSLDFLPRGGGRGSLIDPIKDMKHQLCLGVSLHKNSRVASLSNFKVVCVLYERSEGMAGDMGTVTSITFQAPPSKGRRNNGWQMKSMETYDVHHRGAESVHFVGRAARSMFWVVDDTGTVLAVDNYGRLRCYLLPDHIPGPYQLSTFRFVDNGVKEVESYHHVVRLVSLIGDELSAFVEPERVSVEWDLERTLRLSEVTRGLPGHKEAFFSTTTTAKIVTAWQGFVVLTPAEETWLFSLDLKTMQVERFDNHQNNRFLTAVYPYKLETSPVVKACVHDPDK
ncbi:hypothetical protein QOZ80_6AG0532180 [Eleusine coracana subsp. coracana]|nr:hypothetical protein QOZ80_6AG0532180 [Eleusine coracana subsp. coracana]